MDKTISRSLELELDFKSIYFLIVGDYATETSNCVTVLRDFVDTGAITEFNFVRLIKIMPNHLA